MEMDRRVSPGALRWTRFDDYVITDGVVRPARGAHAEQFDPWDSYEMRTKSSVPAPYQSLLTLHSELRWRHGRDDELQLDGSSEGLLLDWCRQHGLLGILLEDLEFVEFPARWEPPTQPQEKRELVPTARSFRYEGGRWHESIRQSAPGTRDIIARSPGRAHGALVNAHLDGWNEPGVHIHDVESGRVAVLAVDQVDLRRFFLEGHTFADTHVEPASPAFWEVYGEPVALFASRAHSLLHSLEALHDGDPDQLNRLAAHNRQMIVMEGGHAMPRWTSRSLLGAMAAMAMQDVVADGRVLVCAACGVTFVSSAYQARYCSSPCRNRTTQRIHRERLKRRAGDDGGR